MKIGESLWLDHCALLFVVCCLFFSKQDFLSSEMMMSCLLD